MAVSREDKGLMLHTLYEWYETNTLRYRNSTNRFRVVYVTGCRIVRVSHLEPADVGKIVRFSHLVGGVELNDGSWEFCIHIHHIYDFIMAQPNSNTVVDVFYNPFKVLPVDYEYFSDHPTAQYLNSLWLQRRAESMATEGARGFYGALVFIQNSIGLLQI